MVENGKEDLVEQFRSYLDNLPPEPMVSEDKLDLFSFYSELTGLKNEVKIESRQVKKSLTDFQSAVHTLEENSRQDLQFIREQFARQQSKAAREHEQAVPRPLLLALLDIYDRVAAAGQTVVTGEKSFFARFCSRERKIIQAMREGQEITLRRFDELLAQYNVTAVQTLGMQFDPQIMRAVASDDDPRLPDGEVSAELRRGFLINGEVLRLADVRVNRKREQA